MKKTRLYILARGGKLRGVMETFWSICAMPIGLLVCFAPAIIAWVAMGAGSKESSED
jgi:hypothetical protein